MRKFWIALVMVVMLTCMASPVAVEAESYQDRYVIAERTYDNIVPSRYNTIYKEVKRRDASAARTMVAAARDNCLSSTNDAHFFGPSSDRPFDCSSFLY